MATNDNSITITPDVSSVIRAGVDRAAAAASKASQRVMIAEINSYVADVEARAASVNSMAACRRIRENANGTTSRCAKPLVTNLERDTKMCSNCRKSARDVYHHDVNAAARAEAREARLALNEAKRNVTAHKKAQEHRQKAELMLEQAELLIASVPSSSASSAVRRRRGVTLWSASRSSPTVEEIASPFPALPFVPLPASTEVASAVEVASRPDTALPVVPAPASALAEVARPVEVTRRLIAAVPVLLAPASSLGAEGAGAVEGARRAHTALPVLTTPLSTAAAPETQNQHFNESDDMDLDQYDSDA